MYEIGDEVKKVDVKDLSVTFKGSKRRHTW